MDVSLQYLLETMRGRLFSNKEPFLSHCLRKELGKIGRKNLRQNLEPSDVVIYTDFSKGLREKNI